MKIATFNINNINKRLANLLAWLRAARPDIVCLQELKAPDREFPQAAIEKAGYGAVWRGQKSWNGVAILARGSEPIVTRTDLPGDAEDAQARYIEAAVNGVLITSLYAPNGNPQPGPKFAYKLAWTDRLLAHAAELFAAGVPVVLAGDFNVVPSDRDIYPTKSYDKDALLQPETRARFAQLLEQGWRDAVRSLHPDAPIYTYWSYLRNRWPRDAGLRIDHLLLSKQAAKRLFAAGVDREVRGKENASDHAPVWIELRDGTTAEKSAGRARAPSAAPKRPVQRNPRGLRSAQPTLHAKQSKPAAKPPDRPLLVIDGDSFAHRAYHALPKNIRRIGDRPAGAILGFANLLLRLHREEAPRAVLVGWDTYEAPTYRHEQFAAYQSGREFDDDLIEQLTSSRTSSLPAALPTPKARAMRPTISSPPRPRPKSGAAAAGSSPAATATPSSWPRSTPRSFIRSADRGWRASVRRKSAPVTASIRRRCRISSPCAAIPPTSCRVRQASAPPARQRSCANTGASPPSSRPAALPNRPRIYGSFARSPR